MKGPAENDYSVTIFVGDAESWGFEVRYCNTMISMRKYAEVKHTKLMCILKFIYFKKEQFFNYTFC